MCVKCRTSVSDMSDVCVCVSVVSVHVCWGCVLIIETIALFSINLISSPCTLQYRYTLYYQLVSFVCEKHFIIVC